MASIIPALEASPSRILFAKLYGYLPLIVPLVLILQYIRRRYGTAHQYPGPLLASFSRVYQVALVASGKTQLDMMALHSRYGPIVRISPNELSFFLPKQQGSC